MGADPDFRRKRDEAMFREMDAEAQRLQTARAEAAERVRWETQAALDLRVLAEAAAAPAGRRRPPDLPAAAGRDAAARAVRGRDLDRGSLRLERHRLDLGLGPLRTSARGGHASGSRPRRSPSAARWSCAPAAGSGSPSAPRTRADARSLLPRRPGRARQQRERRRGEEPSPRREPTSYRLGG